MGYFKQNHFPVKERTLLMIKVKVALIILFIILLTFTVVTACKEADGDSTSSDKPHVTEGAPETDFGTIVGSETLPPDESDADSSTYLDKILKNFYRDLDHRAEWIYLELGARGTLTVENLNMLILEEQLGMDTEEYSIVVDENILLALRHNDAYGGIGYDQEWSGKIPIALKNLKTDECSAVHELWFILHKTRDANEELSKESSETN